METGGMSGTVPGWPPRSTAPWGPATLFRCWCGRAGPWGHGPLAEQGGGWGGGTAARVGCGEIDQPISTFLVIPDPLVPFLLAKKDQISFPKYKCAILMLGFFARAAPPKKFGPFFPLWTDKFQLQCSRFSRLFRSVPELERTEKRKLTGCKLKSCKVFTAGVYFCRDAGRNSAVPGSCPGSARPCWADARSGWQDSCVVGYPGRWGARAVIEILHVISQ